MTSVKASSTGMWIMEINEGGRAASEGELRPTWLIGIDEVGRGPLAGPITVAAVAVPKYIVSSILYLDGIRDSKKLTVIQREKWRLIIHKNFPHTLVSVSCRVIDKKGIAYAARSAVARCLKNLETKYQIQDTRYKILLDGGLYAPARYKNQQTIIKGDERVPIIAAASIIAKVHRDRYMTRLAKKYPQYGLEKHKGYGTKAHKEAISQFGLSQVHRKSFCKFTEKLKVQSSK